MNVYDKFNRLKEYIKKLGSLAVGFSGGVDSTFLLKVAHDVLGDKAIAITCVADNFPKREENEAADFCNAHGIKQVVCPVNVLEIPDFCANPIDRCYICKKAIFSKIIDVAMANGMEYIAEGSNMDDMSDYRPGLKAIEELKVVSPLREAELYKTEIRRLLKDMNLSVWDKPAYACLATRFVYGEPITAKKLNMVEQAEDYLAGRGFKQFRVRTHGDLARIEVMPDDIPRLLDDTLRQEVYYQIKKIGFSYVALDMQGYRTGSMNEWIK